MHSSGSDGDEVREVEDEVWERVNQATTTTTTTVTALRSQSDGHHSSHTINVMYPASSSDSDTVQSTSEDDGGNRKYSDNDTEDEEEDVGNRAQRSYQENSMWEASSSNLPVGSQWDSLLRNMSRVSEDPFPTVTQRLTAEDRFCREDSISDVARRLVDRMRVDASQLQKSVDLQKQVNRAFAMSASHHLKAAASLGRSLTADGSASHRTPRSSTRSFFFVPLATAPLPSPHTYNRAVESAIPVDTSASQTVPSNWQIVGRQPWNPSTLVEMRRAGPQQPNLEEVKALECESEGNSRGAEVSMSSARLDERRPHPGPQHSTSPSPHSKQMGQPNRQPETTSRSKEQISMRRRQKSPPTLREGPLRESRAGIPRATILLSPEKESSAHETRVAGDNPHPTTKVERRIHWGSPLHSVPRGSPPRTPYCSGEPREATATQVHRSHAYTDFIAPQEAVRKEYTGDEAAGIALGYTSEYQANQMGDVDAEHQVRCFLQRMNILQPHLPNRGKREAMDITPRGGYAGERLSYASAEIMDDPVLNGSALLLVSMLIRLGQMQSACRGDPRELGMCPEAVRVPCLPLASTSGTDGSGSSRVDDAGITPTTPTLHAVKRNYDEAREIITTCMRDDGSTLQGEDGGDGVDGDWRSMPSMMRLPFDWTEVTAEEVVKRGNVGALFRLLLALITSAVFRLFGPLISGKPYALPICSSTVCSYGPRAMVELEKAACRFLYIVGVVPAFLVEEDHGTAVQDADELMTLIPGPLSAPYTPTAGRQFLPREVPFETIMLPTVFPYLTNGTILCDLASRFFDGGKTLIHTHRNPRVAANCIANIQAAQDAFRKLGGSRMSRDYLQDPNRIFWGDKTCLLLLLEDIMRLASTAPPRATLLSRCRIMRDFTATNGLGYVQRPWDVNNNPFIPEEYTLPSTSASGQERYAQQQVTRTPNRTRDNTPNVSPAQRSTSQRPPNPHNGHQRRNPKADRGADASINTTHDTSIAPTPTPTPLQHSIISELSGPLPDHLAYLNAVAKSSAHLIQVVSSSSEWLKTVLGSVYHHTAADETFTVRGDALDLSSDLRNDTPCLIFSDGIVLADLIQELEHSRINALSGVQPGAKTTATKRVNIRRCLDYIRKTRHELEDCFMIEDVLLVGDVRGVVLIVQTLRRLFPFHRGRTQQPQQNPKRGIAPATSIPGKPYGRDNRM